MKIGIRRMRKVSEGIELYFKLITHNNKKGKDAMRKKLRIEYKKYTPTIIYKILLSLNLLYPKKLTKPTIRRYSPPSVNVSLNKPEPQKTTDGMKNIA